MDRSSIIFCIGSVLFCLGIAIFTFPAASVSRETLTNANTPMDAEKMQDIDLGDFGKVTVLEMLNYYLENPPAKTTVESELKETHFQGC
ncbi:MAG: hypothetical protein H8E67_02705 [Proteobacteria bacterium]|jgi:hypothetical protein|nr:hypothetical protein [Pseudomonadota bacterium]MBT5795437.1 hypothetical protein [Deltaproteobacteria bacterium]